MVYLSLINNLFEFIFKRKSDDFFYPYKNRIEIPTMFDW